MVVVPADLVRNLEADRIRDDSFTNMKIESSKIKELVDKIKKQEAVNVLLNQIGLTNTATPSLMGNTLSSTTPTLVGNTVPPTLSPSSPLTTGKLTPYATPLSSLSQTKHEVPERKSEKGTSSSSSSSSSSFTPSSIFFTPSSTTTVPTQSQTFDRIKADFFEGDKLIHPERMNETIKVDVGELEKYLFFPHKSMRAPKGVQELARWIKSSDDFDENNFSAQFKKKLGMLRRSPINVRGKVKKTRLKRLSPSRSAKKSPHQSGKGRKRWIIVR